MTITTGVRIQCTYRIFTRPRVYREALVTFLFLFFFSLFFFHLLNLFSLSPYTAVYKTVPSSYRPGRYLDAILVRSDTTAYGTYVYIIVQ